MRNGKRDCECGDIFMACRCNRPAVESDDLFRNRKTQPSPACVRGPGLIHAIELLKNGGQLVCRDRGPLILNGDNHIVFQLFCPDQDLRIRGAICCCVLQNIIEHPCQLSGVTMVSPIFSRRCRMWTVMVLLLLL